MVKLYALLAALLCSCFSLQLSAQTPAYSLAFTANASATPLNSPTANVAQSVYTPADFPTASLGYMTSIYVHAGSTASGATSFSNLTVKMGYVPFSIFPSSTYATGLTTVFSAATYSPATPVIQGGWMQIPLQAPFFYDPSQNLVVEISQTSYTGGFTLYSGALPGRRISGTLGTPAGTLGSGPVDFGFDLVPAAPCAGSPTPGTATVNNATPCMYGAINLNLTGNSLTIGQTYQWEASSAIAGPYTPISAAQTGSFFSTTAPTSAYYRAAVTCGTNTAYSIPVLVTVPPLFPAGTYTINATQPASSTNFQSFSAAASAINCGTTGPVVFNVSPGTYNDRFLLHNIHPLNNHSVTVNGNGATLSFVSTNSNDRDGIRLDGTDHVTVDNLNIICTGTANTEYGFGIHLLNGADSNTISNCSVTVDTISIATNYVPIVVSAALSSATTPGSNCDGNVFTGNTLNGGYYGLVVYGNASSPFVTNYTITNNVVKNFYAFGIYIYGTNGALIEGNDISRPTRISSTTFAGIIFSGPTQNIVFNKNRIHNAFDAMPGNTSAAYPIFCSVSDAFAGNYNIVSNNLIYDINSSGVLAAIYNSNSDYYKYYHNTISLDDAATTTFSETYGFYQVTTATGLELRNNIISVTRSGAGTKYGIYKGTAATALLSNHNDVYVSGPGTNFFGYSGSGHTTLSAWQSATSQDAASFELNPLFGSAVSGNFIPGNSAIDNAGTPLGITTDIMGQSRSTTTPDMGAYEFTVPACSAPPAPGIASINGASAATVCMGGSITMRLQGYSTGSGISYQWQSSPPGQNNWTVIPGATNPLYSTTFSTPLDYRTSVTCSATIVYSNAVSSSQKAFYFCYCSPNTGITLQTNPVNYTSNVSLAGTTLSSTTTGVFGSGGYSFIDPSTWSNTTTVYKGLPFTVNATQSSSNTSINSELWIDWDQSGTYDAGEYYQLLNTGGISSATVTPPLTALSGLTGMRVRTLLSSTVLYGPTGACTSIPQAMETEEYVITVSTQPSCFPPATVSASSTTTDSATISWPASSSGPASGYQYYFNTSGTPPSSATAPLGSVGAGMLMATLTGLSASTTYYVWVRSVCSSSNLSTWTAFSFSTPPPNDECVNAINITNGQVFTGTTAGATQSMPGCDATPIANDIWYSFTTGSVGGTVTVTANTTTTLTDLVLSVFTGSCNSLNILTPIASSNTPPAPCIDGPAAGIEFGTYTVSPNTTYYVRVYGFNGSKGPFPIQVAGSPLPIKLAKISAANFGDRNRVDWTTITEDEGDYFELERSPDGLTYQTIATIEAIGEPSTYSWWDTAPIAGKSYYRLVVIDPLGARTYSTEVTAIMKGSTAFSLVAQPNPVSNIVKVIASGPLGAIPAISIVDVTGRILKSIKPTDKTTAISLGNIAPGVYMIKYTDSRQSSSVKIIKN